MRGNIAQLMQQAQKMQENMQRAQEELANVEVTGSAGGGMVSVTITGRMECRQVRLDDGPRSHPGMLEHLIPAASNYDPRQAHRTAPAQIGASTPRPPPPAAA